MEAIAFLALLPILGVLALGTFLLWKLFLGVRWVLGYAFRGVGFVAVHVARTLKNEVVDVVHTVGALVTAVAIVPPTLVNFVIGRWAAARHYGRALEDEFVSVLLGVYRIGLGHPLRLIGMGALLNGLERRIPDLVERAPRRPKKRKGGGKAFPGYDVVGTLPAGGSGAQLFLARPRPETYQRLREIGRELPEKVVVKSFALEAGSTLPQIVRESRALEAANRLGLVYEHDLSDDQFYYVMRYVEGDELDTVTQRLHGRAGPEGLGNHELALVLGYSQDLVHTLERFHTGGLWHKDVKPANLIVSGDRAHLVDFGLVTPLQSAMTLTTHGTEYYRDPEMVRLAMQGVKVHEVDGVKFDLYSAGAVLYSMVENSFPAHGSLSSVTKRCPESLSWVIRRAMADIGTRYTSARAMLADLRSIAAANDPFAVRPADLPSFHGEVPDYAPEFEEPLHRVEPLAGGAVGAALANAADSADGAEAKAASCCTPLLADMPRRSWRRKSSGMPVNRRRARRVILGGVVGGILCIGTVRALSHSHSGSSHAHAAFASQDPVRVEIPTLYGSEREAYETAQEILDGVSIDDELRALTEQWVDHLGAVLPDERSSERSYRDAEPLRPGGRVLVLEDQISSVDDSALMALEHALSEGGFQVVGKEDREDDILLVANARHALGLGDPSEGEVATRLKSFLAEKDEVDAVLWVSSTYEAPADSPYFPVTCVMVRGDSDWSTRTNCRLRKPN